MDLLKINQILQRAAAASLASLALLRIAHFISQTTFLWIALGAMVLSGFVSQRAVKRLQARVNVLEEKQGLSPISKSNG